MSRLGDYVHYNWINYKKYGTYTKDDGVSDFNSSIFIEHKEQIHNDILNMRQNIDLKTLEANYNTGANHLNEFLKNTIQLATHSDKESIAFLKKLLLLINKQWSDTTDYIIQYLKWDQQRERIVYDPPVTSAAITADEEEAKRIIASFERARGIHIDVLLAHLTSIKAKLNLLQDSELKKGLQVECDNYILLLNQGKIGNTELEEGVAAITRASKSGRYKKGFLSIAAEEKFDKKGFLATLLSKIQSLTARSASAIFIQNKIGSQLAEMIGTTLASQLNTSCKDEVIAAFKEFVSKGKKTAGANTTKQWEKGLSNTLFFADLDQNFMRQTFVFDGKLSDAIKPTYDKAGNIIEYNIAPFVDKVQQKADFTISMDNHDIGVSMKNYDMSEIMRYEQGIVDPIPTGIHLQDSSLLLYLSGLQLHNTKNDRLGTHYLQILSRQRGYEIGAHAHEIQQMRRQAGEALSLYILWSAATGRGQGRGSESQFADILAIYDKAKSDGKGFRRIRLYSIRDLLLGLVDSDKLKTYALFSPSLIDGKLLLDNSRVGIKPSNKDAKTRITELLMQARTKNIAVSLSKIYLNNFPRLK